MFQNGHRSVWLMQHYASDLSGTEDIAAIVRSQSEAWPERTFLLRRFSFEAKVGAQG
jgi:hypothetical protein